MNNSKNVVLEDARTNDNHTIQPEFTAKRRLLKMCEAASYLAISERTLWTLAYTKEIRAVKIRRAVRFDIQDLDEFIAKAKVARLC